MKDLNENSACCRRRFPVTQQGSRMQEQDTFVNRWFCFYAEQKRGFLQRWTSAEDAKAESAEKGLTDSSRSENGACQPHQAQQQIKLLETSQEAAWDLARCDARGSEQS